MTVSTGKRFLKGLLDVGSVIVGSVVATEALVREGLDVFLAEMNLKEALAASGIISAFSAAGSWLSSKFVLGEEVTEKSRVQNSLAKGMLVGPAVVGGAAGGALAGIGAGFAPILEEVLELSIWNIDDIISLLADLDEALPELVGAGVPIGAGLIGQLARLQANAIAPERGPGGGIV